VSKKFDATLKDLGREHPHGFLTAFDQPPTLPVSLLNVDLSTVTTAADLVLGLGDPVQEIIHMDFQASAAAWKHADILVYQSLLFAHYHVPVHSIVVLLRPQAAHSNMSGAIQFAPRPGRGKMDFGYEVIRLWERPAEELLAGDLGLVPLAQLGKLPSVMPVEEGISGIIDRTLDRLLREAPAEQVKKLLTASFILSGLRLEPEFARQLYRGASAMKESATHLSILDEGRDMGREEEAKRIILRLGEKRFGPPDESFRAEINAIKDINRLESLVDSIIGVSSWQELLQTME
jgi:hypothetical protein